MKKGLLLVVVMLATIAVKAQDIYVGGSLNVWRNSTGNTTSFKVAPEIGYNFNETWALGAELNYSHEYVKQVTANTVTVAPYIGSVIILGDLTICHKSVSLRYAT